MKLPLPLLYVVLGLALYRAQRFVTADDWPPSEASREWVAHRFGRGSSWYNLVTCPWCLGAWVALMGTVLTHAFVADLLTGHIKNRMALVAMLCFAQSCIVGVIGSKLDD